MIPSSCTVTVEEDQATGELYIIIPPEMLKEINWSEDDELEWTELPNGSWSLSKLE